MDLPGLVRLSPTPPTPPDDSGQGYKGQAKYFHDTQNGIKEIYPHCFFLREERRKRGN